MAQLARFDFGGVIDAFSMIVIGARRSGKSLLIKDIVFQVMHKYKHFMVFSETLNNGWYSSFVDNSMLFGPEHVMDLEGILTRTNEPTLIIFDDVIDMRNSKLIEKVFVHGRHSNVSIIVSCQRYTMLSPVMRSNADYCAVFAHQNMDLFLRILRENNLIMDDTTMSSRQRQMRSLDIARTVTDNHGIIINDSTRSHSYLDHARKYRVNSVEIGNIRRFVGRGDLSVITALSVE